MSKRGLAVLFAGLLTLTIGVGWRGAVGGDAAPSADPNRPDLIHGDSSVSDDELVNLYAGKIQDEIFLDANCKKMAPVLFHHKEHVDRKLAACTNCHHQDPKKQVKCSECHTPAPQDPKALKYQKAHHGLCHKCHKARRKGAQGPPVKCLECHKKENTPKAEVNCPVPQKPGETDPPPCEDESCAEAPEKL